MRFISPISVHYEITESCNQNCSHCYNHSKIKNYIYQKTNIEKINRILDEIIESEISYN